MPRWITKDVQVVFPAELVHAMFHVAERYDVEQGGRYDRRGAAILVWSASLTSDAAAEPQGEAYFSWRTPTAAPATLSQIGWHPSEGGSEEVGSLPTGGYWEALGVLAGRSVRPR